MTNVKHTVSSEERQQLAALVGQKLAYITGFGVKRFLMSALLLIVTSEAVVDISSSISTEDFPGYREDFGFIRVGKSLESDISVSQREGTRFFTFAGEKIERVEIRRATISKVENGANVWEYSADVAILIKVASGWISLSLLNHHDQILTVTYTGKNEQLDIPETDSLFESDLFESYEVVLEDEVL
jgi:hypothetical protein